MTDDHDPSIGPERTAPLPPGVPQATTGPAAEAAAGAHDPWGHSDPAPTAPGPAADAGWSAGPTTPGGWPASGPTTPGGWPAGDPAGGWHAGAPAQHGPGWSGWGPPGSGWGAPASGWQPPGGGWVPPGGGWVPPGGGWPQPPHIPPGGRRRRLTAALVAVSLVALLVGAGVVGYVVHSPGSPSASQTASAGRSRSGLGTLPTGRTTTTTSSSSSGGSSSSSGSPSNTAAIAAEVDPGLVDINTTLKDYDEQAAGTGMVLTSTGEILTNNHVIEGATTISVTDIGNGKTYSATVVGYDRSEDVAVIQLKDASGLKTVDLGNSATAAKGEGVVGIGNAGGVGGAPSVAGGSITALGQSITASDEGDGTSEKLTDLIETNCDIQPGDSGGPLVNSQGQVLGMDTAASEASSGGGFYFHTPTGQTAANQGYAIPIDTALTLAKKIEAGQASTTVHIGKTAFLGVNVAPTGTTSSSSTGRLGFGFGTSSTATATPSAATTKGARIVGVVAGDPAAAAGIAKGDVIIGFAGKTITSTTALTSTIESYHPGSRVKVTWVTSSGQTQSATVTLATGPSA